MKVDFARLDRAFNPRCVVVVGDKREGDFRWLSAQKTFKGKLYSVQINPETIREIEALGIKNYTSLLDVPEPVDLVIVAVPRKVTPQILEDCIRKDVGVAHLFTAGFSETGTEEGIRLERQLAGMAEESNFHLIGPNCMGIFNPRAGVRQMSRQYTDVSGPVGFISQSGTHAVGFALEAHLQGVDISKSVSFGNGVVLDSADFLEYLGQDPGTGVIGMYLEGVRDGRKFLRVLKEVAARKPVVIWKGGRTRAGERAIASHTASLAVPRAIWDAVIKQCGAVGVSNMEELIDTLKALLYLPPVRGGRVAVTGGSGGQSVAIADVFAEAGLELPALTRQSYDELSQFYSLIGGGCGNPVDTGNQNRFEIGRILEILERDTNTDSLVVIMQIVSGLRNPEEVKGDIELLISLKAKTLKPILVVIHSWTSREMTAARKVSRQFQERGIPVFPSMERAAGALRNALAYSARESEVAV